MEYYSIIKNAIKLSAKKLMELDIIVLNEIKQDKKTKDPIILLIWSI
jgi:hypothetical protein